MSQPIAPDTLRQVRRVQAITIAWMSIEAAVSLFAAWRARSPALLAFGGDSGIELMSAVIVPGRFGTKFTQESLSVGRLESPEDFYLLSRPASIGESETATLS